jgi:hypothetical protein
VLLAAVGFVGCVTVIVGAWVARQKASEKVRAVAACAGDGLERATTIDDKLDQALQKARNDMKTFNEQADGLGSKDDESKRRSTGLIRRRVESELGPNLHELRGRLATFSDAAVAVASLLKSYQEMRPSSANRLKPEQIEAVSESATKLAAVSRRLQTAVGDGDKSIEDKEIRAAIKEVDSLLERCQNVVDDLHTDLMQARTDLPHLEAEVQWWMMAIAIAITVLFAWGALGQVSLFAHGLNWCRSA